jgi:molecular chaperone DnaJ
MKDYYSVLGISKSASDEEIKKAYRKLAHKHHPDKTGGEDKQFKEVNEAYQVIGNKEKRAQYDRFGATFDGAGGGAGGGGFGFDPNGAQWNVNVGDIPNINEIFDNFFGGRARGGSRRGIGVNGNDIEILQEITLEDAFRGVTRSLRFKTYGHCPECGSKGYDESAGKDKCTECNGSGEVKKEMRTILGNMMQSETCSSCEGGGEKPKKQCTKCNGDGRLYEVKEVSLDISPGVEDGQTIQLTGKGESGAKGGRDGDLFLHIRVKPHTVFSRSKNELVMERKISVIDALLGKEVVVKDIGGDTIGVVIPSGFDVSEPLRVSGRGMPKFGHYRGPSSRGDLYIKFKLTLPKKMSKKAKELLTELEKELK